EASRVAHMAAGSSRGLAQSLFQVGGNAGSSLGPLLAALLIVPRGQGHVAWFSVAAFLGVFVLWRVALSQVHHLRLIRHHKQSQPGTAAAAIPRKTVVWSLAILVALIFSKYIY